MQEGSFEISINKDVNGKEVDVNHLSLKAAHSFNTFLESLTKIAELSINDGNLSIDLGTNKVGIKSSIENIEKLEKNLRDVSELKSKNKTLIKLWSNIQDTISANGIQYSAIIKGSKSESNVTQIFKQETKFEVREPAEAYSNDSTGVGLKFYKGRIFELGGKKITNVHIEFSKQHTETISKKDTLVAVCEEKDVFNLKRHLGVRHIAYITCYFFKDKTEKLVKKFYDEYSEEEFETLNSFYQSLSKLEGTEKLKNIYRFFNNYIVKDELSRVEKFARVFLFDTTDVSILRIIIDVLKQVSDEDKIKDIYNAFIELISKKIGSIY